MIKINFMWPFKKKNTRRECFFSKTVEYKGFYIFTYVPQPEMKTHSRQDAIIYNHFEPHVDVVGQLFGYYTTATDDSLQDTLIKMESDAKKFIDELLLNPSKLHELKKSLV